ncbi:hypothetical protein PR003_g26410 [Phytophthora rubi]|uniref:Uncharacterized protein n=1 Tax=Phytophthora rubi TaxID=129364 RepID=A0A6A4C6K3_9STRA|nr:hypothetical protein PR002_g25442 [Phytophthora rubi]KAE9286090.1 hypothetical protein PR003_g26410 [Phytophthora rubi]
MAGQGTPAQAAVAPLWLSWIQSPTRASLYRSPAWCTEILEPRITWSNTGGYSMG